MYKIIKTTVLLSGLFTLVGCGACCEDDVLDTKSVVTTDIPTTTTTVSTIEEKGDTPVDTQDDTPIVVTPIPPIAIINDGEAFITIPPCTTVEFTSDASSDPDGDDENLTFNWTGIHACPMSDESSFEHKFGKKGLYETTLAVTDAQNLTSIDRVCVLVGIDESQMPLIADAGTDIEVGVDQNFTLAGRAICRDDVASFAWKLDGQMLL